MIKTDKLLGIMAEKGKTRKDVANAIGVAPKTFYEKMKKGVFGSDEIQTMIDYLDIKDPMAVFFAQKVTCKDTLLKEN